MNALVRQCKAIIDASWFIQVKAAFDLFLRGSETACCSALLYSAPKPLSLKGPSRSALVYGIALFTVCSAGLFGLFSVWRARRRALPLGQVSGWRARGLLQA